MDNNKPFMRKQNIKTNTGFTLVEIIVVIVIIAILAAILIPSLTRYIDMSRGKADLGQLGFLNRVTQAYRIENSAGDPFLDTENSSEVLMDYLVTEKFLSEPLEAKLPGAYFQWSFQSNLEASQWIYVKEDGTVSSIITHIFGGKELSDYIKRTGSWEEDNLGFYSSSGFLFLENPKTDYSITSNAKLLESGTGGGYGIFFETTIVNSLGNGHILQFDRALGGLVIKKRIGYTSDQVVLKIGKKQGESGIGDSSVIPTDRNDPWWTDNHEITIEVSSSQTLGEKKLKVIIDNTTVLEDYSFTPDNASGDKFTGLRSWGAKTNYESLIIQ